MTPLHSRAIVLGAGIQGICAALALADRGHRVTLVDAADDCMQRTSVQNEGKIHLGFVYANDPSARTPELMLDGALAFGNLLERWTGRALPWDRLRSRPFTYLVLDDSMVAPEAIFAAYAKLEDGFEARGRGSYLGLTPDRLWNEVSVADLGTSLAPDRVAAAARTTEVAVDRILLRHHLRTALHAHPRITTRYGHTVHDAARAGDGFTVSGTRGDGEQWTDRAPVVVNCLWDHRIALDAQVGIAAPRSWVYRLKYRVLGQIRDEPAELPSISMVLGPYGDLVVHPGRPTYLSWYPACLAGWDTATVPPSEWREACTGNDERAEAGEIARATVAAMAEIVPALADFRIESVNAGVIVAWGSTDIDDRASELHERHDIGVHEHDGWFSIDTGKFTTAPLFAARLAGLVGPPT